MNSDPAEPRLPWPIVTELRPGERWPDVGRDLYLRASQYLFLASLAGEEPMRSPVQRYRLARRAAQIGFLKLAFGLELGEIAATLGLSLRTTKRASALLRRALAPRPPDH
jgi:hypothetical protein